MLDLDPAVLTRVVGPWSPVPVRLPQDAIDAVDAACRSYADVPATASLRVVDARGDGLVDAFYFGPPGRAVCYDLLITDDGVLLVVGNGMVDPSFARDAPGPNEVAVWELSRQESPRPIVYVAGPVGSNVARVRLSADGAPDVLPTVMDGWFAAWQYAIEVPSQTIRGYDANGVEIFTSSDT